MVSTRASVYSSIKGWFSIRNLGKSTTDGRVPWRILLSPTDKVEDAVGTLDYGTVPALKGGKKSRVVTFNAPPPANLLGQSLYALFVIDPDRTLPDATRSNNARRSVNDQIQLATTLTTTTFTSLPGGSRFEFSEGDDYTYLVGGLPGVPNGYGAILMDDVDHFSLNLGAGDDGVQTRGVMPPFLIHAGGGNDKISTGGANDTIYGEAGADAIDGSGGDDLIYGGTGRDALSGNAGSDTLFGDNDADTLRGGDEDDRLSCNGSDDSLIGDDGDDVFDAVDPAADPDYPPSLRRNDILKGGSGRDDAVIDDDATDVLTSIERSRT